MGACQQGECSERLVKVTAGDVLPTEPSHPPDHVVRREQCRQVLWV